MEPGCVSGGVGTSTLKLLITNNKNRNFMAKKGGKGRPKPNVPRAGFRSDKARYDGGGKLKK